MVCVRQRVVTDAVLPRALAEWIVIGCDARELIQDLNHEVDVAYLIVWNAVWEIFLQAPDNLARRVAVRQILFNQERRKLAQRDSYFLVEFFL